MLQWEYGTKLANSKVHQIVAGVTVAAGSKSKGRMLTVRPMAVPDMNQLREMLIEYAELWHGQDTACGNQKLQEIWNLAENE